MFSVMTCTGELRIDIPLACAISFKDKLILLHTLNSKSETYLGQKNAACHFYKQQILPAIKPSVSVAAPDVMP